MLPSIGQKNELACALRREVAFVPNGLDENLSRRIFADLEVRSTDRVLDPFAGLGETLVWSQLLGVEAIGLELNPLYASLAQLCLGWSVQKPEIEPLARVYGALIGMTHPRLLAEHHRRLGAIPKSLFWGTELLHNALGLDLAISQLPEADRPLASLSLCAILLREPGALATESQVAPEAGALFGLFEAKLASLAALFAELARLAPDRTARCRRANALEPFPEAIRNTTTHVLTNPPWPERHSYAIDTYPLLSFYGHVHDTRQARQLDCAALGGALVSSIRNTNRPLPGAAATVLGALDDNSGVSEMGALYLRRYYANLADHIASLDQLINPSLRLGYAIADFTLEGLFLQNSHIVPQMLRDAGWHCDPAHPLGHLEKIGNRYDCFVVYGERPPR